MSPPHEDRPGQGTEAIRKSRARTKHDDTRPGYGQLDLEIALLAHMTTPDGMAEVVESGLSGEVFVVPLHQAVFRFAREYWDAQGTAPSAKVLGTEYPGLDVEAPKGEDGALGWVIWKLFKRRQTNRLQDMLRSAAETMHSDPLDAAKTLQLAAGQMLEQTGRSSGEGIYADVGAMLDNRLPESPKPEVLARSDGSAVTD